MGGHLEEERSGCRKVRVVALFAVAPVVADVALRFGKKNDE